MKTGFDGVVRRGYHKLLVCISSHQEFGRECFETAVGGYWVNVFRTCISETFLMFSMSNCTVCSHGNS